MSEEERTGQEVPAFYTMLGWQRGTVHPWDRSKEARLWKDLKDQSDEARVHAAAAIIEAYTAIGSYPASGEDFHHLAVFMGSLGYLSWAGEEELERFLADNRPEIERRVREIHAHREQDEHDQMTR